MNSSALVGSCWCCVPSILQLRTTTSTPCPQPAAPRKRILADASAPRKGILADASDTPSLGHSRQLLSSYKAVAAEPGGTWLPRPWDYCFPDSRRHRYLWICFKMLSGHLFCEMLKALLSCILSRLCAAGGRPLLELQAVMDIFIQLKSTEIRERFELEAP